MKTQFNLSFAVAGLLTLVILIILASAKTEAVEYALTARGVDVYLVTDSTHVATNHYLTADIIITNDGTPLNAMEAEVYFNPEYFSIAEVSFGKDLCEERFIIDKVVDNYAGKVHLSCGTIKPFNGNATVFGTLKVLPLQAGITELNFGENTHVHVHDGLGTEIVRDTYSTTLVIEAQT